MPPPPADDFVDKQGWFSIAEINILDKRRACKPIWSLVDTKTRVFYATKNRMETWRGFLTTHYGWHGPVSENVSVRHHTKASFPAGSSIRGYPAGQIPMVVHTWWYHTKKHNHTQWYMQYTIYISWTNCISCYISNHFLDLSPNCGWLMLLVH